MPISSLKLTKIEEHGVISLIYTVLLFIAADCYLNNSEEYRGTIDYTVSGKTCQAWNVNFPHTVDYQPIDPTAGTTNYCRETSHREGGPVCYTTDLIKTLLVRICFHLGFDIRYCII
jgi:hypothetical protein